MTLELDPALLAWIDQSDRKTTDLVRRYGVQIVYVSDDQCDCCAALNRADRRRAQRKKSVPFAYTVGLFGLGHPELLVFGLDQVTTSGILNHLAARVRDGDDLMPGELLTFLGWSHRVTVETVPNPGQIAFEANRFYQRPDEYSVPLLQLTYDDAAGRFPWEAGCAIPTWMQPRPREFRA